MQIELDRDSKTPLYLQIVEQVRSQIQSGELEDGYTMPPERRLADSLGVNRTTILNAYRELKAENLISSHIGRGTVVLPLPEKTVQPRIVSQEPVWEYFYSQNSMHFEDPQFSSMLNYINHKHTISFASGIAYPSMETEAMLKNILHKVIDEEDFSTLLGTPTEGYSSLRNAMGEFMQKRGCDCKQNDVMILSGSQQGIDLIARVLLEPGDIVVVEEPTYMPALQVFRSIGARIISVPVDEDGMNTEVLEQVVRRYHPKLVYTMPAYHNPTGVSLSFGRRMHLMKLSNQYKMLILEDDAYGELCYEGRPEPALKSLDRNGFVIYLSTFSKILYPGLRVGWIAAHKTLITRLASVRKAMDLHTNSLSQKIIENFISGDFYSQQLEHVCAIYRQKRDTMLTALQEYAPPGMTWMKPTGGYYIWCRLPGRVDTARLLARAAEQGVSFIPGNLFFASPKDRNFVRLNFTYAGKEQIRKGIKILCTLIGDGQKADRRASPREEALPFV